MQSILVANPQPAILHQTLQPRFVPGSNLTGGLAGAAWRFLLPTLRPQHVLFLGKVPISTLDIFAGISELVLLAVPDAFASSNLHDEIKKQPWRNVRIVSYHSEQRLPLKERSIDLIVLADGFDLQNVKRHNLLLTELARVLHDEGVIYFEIRNVLARGSGQVFLKFLELLRVDGYRAFWLTPFQGEWRTAFPLNDDRNAEQLFSAVLYGQSFKNRLASRLGQIMSRAKLVTPAMPRRAVLVQRSRLTRKLDSPPRYLVDTARRSGIDLEGMRYWVSARGKYNSNKTVFFLYQKPGTRMQIVAKMTRAPQFNRRLENEFRALREIRAHHLVNLDTVPEPLFFGLHAGLAILGQTAVQGKPFRSSTRAAVDCHIARNAVDWIVELGRGSTPGRSASAAEVHAVLAELLQRIAAVYSLRRDEYEFLQAQVACFLINGATIPLVFFHGDLGTWNILVSDVDDRVIVIDWEAADPMGLPLWDLVYFLRSYVNWIFRKKGQHDGLASFREAFFSDSEAGAHVTAAVRHYCNAVGLEPRFAEPLFYACWMHRALKEAARLTPETLDSGRFFQMLRFSIRHRASLGIARL